jgi:type VI secretion system secreted protein Hcp
MSAVDYFLKLDPIKGESQDDKHKGEIDIYSFSFGAAQHGSFAAGGGGGSGKVKFNDFKIQKSLDAASPKLFLACANGQHFDKAVLTCRKAGKDKQEYLIITFKTLLISSYSVSGGGPGSPHEGGLDNSAARGTQAAAADTAPVEHCTLNFSEVAFSYKTQNPDGTLGGATSGGWNISTQKEVTS